MLFGIPEHKDAVGSGAVDPGGILNLAINDVVGEVGDALTVMSDLCLDEFTDHGHCGVLTADGRVDNDATLTVYAEMARAQAAAGVDMVGPSGMMDGQVAAIRTALDEAEHQDVSILAYSAKYASSFYGPFREAVDSSLEGDRRTYQQDSANAVEGVREALLDVAEGADIVMVKPALAYLDVVRRVRDAVDVPVAAYNVSGEYAMVEAAAANGWIDREAAILETLTSIRRAGADVILTYWAADAARLLRPSSGRPRPTAEGPLGPLGDNDPVDLLDRRLPRALRPGAGRDPRRRELAGAGVHRRRRNPPVHRVRASGAWLRDVDGNEYVDLVCSWGPMLLGHAHPEVRGGGRSGGQPRYVVRHPDRFPRSSWPRRSSPARRSTRSGSSPRARRRPCPRSGWPGGSPAAT